MSSHSLVFFLTFIHIDCNPSSSSPSPSPSPLPSIPPLSSPPPTRGDSIRGSSEGTGERHSQYLCLSGTRWETLHVWRIPISSLHLTQSQSLADNQVLVWMCFTVYRVTTFSVLLLLACYTMCACTLCVCDVHIHVHAYASVWVCVLIPVRTCFHVRWSVTSTHVE